MTLSIPDPRELSWPAATSGFTDFVHWQHMWTRLGGRTLASDTYHSLLRHYAQPHRAYHTRQHLEECLALLNQATSLCVEPHEVAAALWFHDAIYLPRRSDNEVKSAEWLAEVARKAGVPSKRIDRLHGLVMATRHDSTPQDPDAQVLLDIDLSILGAPNERFDEYESQIRTEYRWVPSLLYKRKRRQVLSYFTIRPRIDSTLEFQRQFEARARHNLNRSLARAA